MVPCLHQEPAGQHDKTQGDQGKKDRKNRSVLRRIKAISAPAPRDPRPGNRTDQGKSDDYVHFMLDRLLIFIRSSPIISRKTIRPYTDLCYQIERCSMLVSLHSSGTVAAAVRF